MSCLTQGLGIGLRSSGRIVGAFNHWSISSVCGSILITEKIPQQRYPSMVIRLDQTAHVCIDDRHVHVFATHLCGGFLHFRNLKRESLFWYVFETIILYLIKNLPYGNAYHIHKGVHQ